MAKEKKKRRLLSLDAAMDLYESGVNPPPEWVNKVDETEVKTLSKELEKKDRKMIPWKSPSEKDAETKVEPEQKKGKQETLNSIKKRVEEVYKEHVKELPPTSRILTAKDIKEWILNNPGQNVSSETFFNWYRSPDGIEVNPYVKKFGELLQEMNIEHSCNVEVKGYVYDFFIESMSLYIDIDPTSLETDDPKNKLTITIDKNKIDVVDIWRKINDTRAARCKPYRFFSIKERLYAQGVKEFLQEFVDWYYQKLTKEN